MTFRTSSYAACFAVLLGAATLPALVAAPASKKIADAGAASISKQLAAAVDRGDTPGVVAAVVDRDGVLYEGAAGKLDVGNNVPMPVNAIFNIASMPSA